MCTVPATTRARDQTKGLGLVCVRQLPTAKQHSSLKGVIKGLGMPLSLVQLSTRKALGSIKSEAKRS